jgi:hypothetical protein
LGSVKIAAVLFEGPVSFEGKDGTAGEYENHRTHMHEKPGAQNV